GAGGGVEHVAHEREPYRVARLATPVTKFSRGDSVSDTAKKPHHHKKVVTVLEPEDEYTHEPDAAENYNEAMYLNAFDVDQEVGGWYRLGSRVNEGYAEMTVCLSLPGGRVGFVYGRAQIDSDDKMEAGGLSIEVVEPFKQLKVRYQGKVCLLDEPGQMADPRTAFKENPWVECEVDLDYRGVSPMYGG